MESGRRGHHEAELKNDLQKNRLERFGHVFRAADLSKALCCVLLENHLKN
jgi:hypothetical protein